MKRLKNTKQLVFDFMEGLDIHTELIFDYSVSWPNYEPPNIDWPSPYSSYSWQYSYSTTASTGSDDMSITYDANYLGRIIYGSLIPTNTTFLGSTT